MKALQRNWWKLVLITITAISISSCVPQPTSTVAPILVAEDDGGGVDLWMWAKNHPSFMNSIAFTTQGGMYGNYDGGDAFAIGDVWGDSKEEIIVAEDNGGGVDLWTWDASTGKFQLAGVSFTTQGGVYGNYDGGDAFAVGDVWGDGKEEIIVAEDNGGGVDIWSWDAGKGKFELAGVSFTTQGGVYGNYDGGDAFAVGDVWGDSKEEIIVAEDNGGGVDIWAWDASKGKFQLAGVSFTTQGGVYGNYDGGDAFAVGDVWGDSKEEIVVAEDNGGGVDIWSWDTNKSKFQLAGVSFTTQGTNKYGWYDKGDAFAVGNVTGDSKEEVVVAEDDGGGVDIWGWDANTGKFQLDEVSFSTHAGKYGWYDSGDALVIGKPAPVVCVYGTITDGNNHPLIDVHVRFNDLTNSKTANTYSDQDGKYSACTFAGIQANLTVILENSGVETAVIRIVDQATNPVSLTTNNFSLSGDLTQDINFGNTAIVGATNVTTQQLPDFATMYFHTSQALDYAQSNLGLRLDNQLPEDVYGFNAETITYHCPGICAKAPAGAGNDYIAIAAIDSLFASPDRPDNREWHEFGHHIMLDSPIAGDNSQPSRLPGDMNHAGFANQNTADSWMEGWAEFTSLVVADVIENDPQPNLYRFSGGDPLLTGGNYGGPNDDLERNWRVREDEEFAVASILWDLYDGGPGDDDNVDLTLQQIFDTVAQPQVTNLRQVYLAFQAFFNNTSGLNIQDLDTIFIRHGASGEPYTDSNGDAIYNPGEAFMDQNGNGVWDENTNVGYSPDGEEPYTDNNGNGNHDPGEPFTDLNTNGAWDSARPLRENKPPRHGSNLCVTVVDENNKPVTNTDLVITRQDGASYTIHVPESPGRVYFYMPPDPTTFHVVAHKDGNRDSLPLLIASELYWRKTRYTGQECFMTHTFILNDPLANVFESISSADIRRTQLSSSMIANDGLMGPYVIVLAQTNEGRYVKALVRTTENVDGLMELEIGQWVTYNPDGSVFASGGPARINSGGAWDLDRGTVDEDAVDMRWQSQSPGVGYLMPEGRARLGVKR